MTDFGTYCFVQKKSPKGEANPRYFTYLPLSSVNEKVCLPAKRSRMCERSQWQWHLITMQISRCAHGGKASKELPMVAYNHNDVAEVALLQCQMVVACAVAYQQQAVRGQRLTACGRRSPQEKRWQSRKLINFNLHTK
jgi:hypothetical protein